ncbi:MAG: hypothetical protein JWM12_807 [Ilumatobacteraceae bacterium]|nr:hypothetical protein [Ilumatobacteraceae bacterium]
MKVYAPPVTTYRIKDVAERSGFSAPTLRYYEDIRLLPAPARSERGYRLYDEQTFARLAFIARAKQLGCTLEEIGDLSAAWDGGRCGPVQDRLREVVAEKLAAAERQIDVLTTLTADLQRAAAALERHRPEGRCDDTCGCVSDPTADAPAPIAQGVQLSSKPISCTLDRGSLRDRITEWHALLAHAMNREVIDRGIRISLQSGAPLDELIRLTAAEQDCCQSLSFAITVDSRGVALEVRSPDDAGVLVAAVFGAQQ